MADDVDPAEVLFKPLSINTLTLANRIVLSPMAVVPADAEGNPSDQAIAFFRERAKGGVGMIIVGGGVSTPRAVGEGPFKGAALRHDDDRFIPGLKRMTDAAHEWGVPIVVELMAGFGPMSKPSPQWPMIAASPQNIVIKQEEFPKGIIVPGGRVTGTPREATIEEIHEVEQQMIDAALRCQRAGFDGVEIAAMMSYFLASFLSPRTNWRTDEYGGSVENRARMLVNIVRGIREKLGGSYPIGLRISANEHCEGGQGPDGYAAIAAHVEHEAGIDYVALTDGTYVSMRRSAPATDAPTIEHGEAQVFREALSCTLILGSIHNPQRAAEAVAAGHGDAVMFARQLLADSEYANKVRDGRLGEIVECDRNNVCMRRLAFNMPVRCTVNPRMGRESRAPGERPPARRLIEAPIEHAVLALTGSERVMGLVGKLPRKQA